MREMVEELYQSMLQISADLKAKHLKELILLKTLKEGKLNTSAREEGDHGKQDEQEGHLPPECRMPLRFRSGTKPQSYAIDSGDASMENYFDNLN